MMVLAAESLVLHPLLQFYKAFMSRAVKRENSSIARLRSYESICFVYRYENRSIVFLLASSLYSNSTS